MNVQTEPNVRLKGEVIVPSSKSAAQRAIAAACLAKGRSVLHNISYSDDVNIAIGLAESLGARVDRLNSSLVINGNFSLKNNVLFVGESGLSTRMFVALAALQGREFIVGGKGTIVNRPMTVFERILPAFGLEVETTGGFLPLRISGKLKPANVLMDASDTSQILTGLLMALPLSGGRSVLRVENLKSRPYIDLTLDIMEHFGVSIENYSYRRFVVDRQKYVPADLFIEGDWSGAAFWFVAAAISGDILIKGLDKNSKQADKAIIDVMKSSGVDVRCLHNGYRVRKSRIKPFVFDATDSPDLFPALAVLAANANGISKIKGVHRLAHKESNRARAIVENFVSLGIKCVIDDDFLIIEGGQKIGSGIFRTYSDHRMAMAGAVLSLTSGELEIDDKKCVSKSYPGFFEQFEKLKSNTGF